MSPASSDILRQKLVDLRAKLVAEHAAHIANVNVAAGALQVLDMLLEPEPPVPDDGGLGS